MAFLAGAVTRALDMYVDNLWAKGVKSGIDKLFPHEPDGLLDILLYALVLSVVVIIVRQFIEFVMSDDKPKPKQSSPVR